jgi:hypothetical protein
MPIIYGLAIAVFTFVMAIVGCFIISLIINALAPTFGGEKNSSQAFKVAVYSYTPAWVAGVLNLVPLLGILAIFAALYGLYLLYLGLPRLMKCPPDKAVGYTAVVVVCAIVVTMVIGAVGGVIAGAGLLATGGLSSIARDSTARETGSRGEVQYDKNSALGKLQALGNKLEESNKKMAAAQKSGDQGAQAAAAIESLGTLLGGGKRVDPIDIDELKPLVPDTFAGLPKTRSNAEKNGFAGIMVSKAEATYSDQAQKNVTLEISDTGGVSGLVSFASWASLQQEKDDENGSERTRKVGGRLVHERLSKTGGSNEFSLVIGDRFVVSAKGNGVSLEQLKSAVSSLDLGRLESMKEAGVQR